jgi:glucosamine-6-phosphate deaminase
MSPPQRQFTAGSLNVHIFANRTELGAAAGSAAANEINGVISQKGNARVILASAPSQNELLATLTSATVDWSRVTLFHMDEYIGIDAGNSASFRKYQAEHVLSRIEPAAFHGILGEAPDPERECARYAQLLEEAPIDVVCLGIGENGHLAFNDPPVADFDDPCLVKIVELDEICRQQQVHDGCFPSIEAVPCRAITLTMPALLRGKALFCAVPGPRKAKAVYDTIQGPIATACPASILRNHRNATLYLDRDSASLVPHPGRG